MVLRTLDAGGDKPLPAGWPEPEDRELRGVALSLRRPDLLRVQLRAMLRAAAYGDVRILLPMVSRPDEPVAVAALLAQERAALAAPADASATPRWAS